MSNNAQWRVDYRDADGGQRALYLCSPDLVNPKAAHKRARDTAKARLAKKGIKARIVRSVCVG